MSFFLVLCRCSLAALGGLRIRPLNTGAVSASLDVYPVLHAQHYGAMHFDKIQHGWHATLVHHHCRCHSCSEYLNLAVLVCFSFDLD